MAVGQPFAKVGVMGERELEGGIWGRRQAWTVRRWQPCGSSSNLREPSSKDLLCGLRSGSSTKRFTPLLMMDRCHVALDILCDKSETQMATFDLLQDGTDMTADEQCNTMGAASSRGSARRSSGPCPLLDASQTVRPFRLRQTVFPSLNRFSGVLLCQLFRRLRARRRHIFHPVLWIQRLSCQRHSVI